MFGCGWWMTLHDSFGRKISHSSQASSHIVAPRARRLDFQWMHSVIAIPILARHTGVHTGLAASVAPRCLRRRYARAHPLNE